ncbi:MAG: MBOAT family O-acyltransferase [Anaerolinea sp.]
MGFAEILVLLGLAALYGALLPAAWRAWALMLGSALAIYWLQPLLVIRWLDYSLPTAMLALTVACWWLSKPHDGRRVTRQDALALALILAVIVGLALARYVDVPELLRLTSRPPELAGVLLALALGWGIAFGGGWLAPRRAAGVGLLLVIGLLGVLQTPALAEAAAAALRVQSGQNPALASPLDLRWLGFSYVAFRLIHTLRDRQTGILPDLSLRDYVTFVVFAPAFSAGPIDRAERFQTDMAALPALRLWDNERVLNALERIGVGLFKKFVIADSLALFALSPENADQAVGGAALWVMLYAYGLRLFFDFSGYTDIAIGLGRLFGVTLPENFNRPYLRANITAFWQAWHMSLTNWVRFYVFSPLSRALLKRDPKPPNELIMFVCHLSTMALIGVWHGVTLPFLIWGVWHGLGLWLHKLWSDRTRGWYLRLKKQPRRLQAWTAVAWLLTFHFVMVGWVWFTLPDAAQALRVFGRLFGN